MTKIIFILFLSTMSLAQTNSNELFKVFDTKILENGEFTEVFLKAFQKIVDKKIILSHEEFDRFFKKTLEKSKNNSDALLNLQHLYLKHPSKISPKTIVNFALSLNFNHSTRHSISEKFIKVFYENSIQLIQEGVPSEIAGNFECFSFLNVNRKCNIYDLFTFYPNSDFIKKAHNDLKVILKDYNPWYFYLNSPSIANTLKSNAFG